MVTLKPTTAIERNPEKFQAVVQRLRDILPQLTAVILFGSQASHLADDFSDYDLIVLVPDGLDPIQRRAVEQQLRSDFPSLRLDFVFGSERSLLASLPYEPARRFWLENGIALWGSKPIVENYPPLARGALLSHLNIIESEIGVARTAEDDHTRCRVCADALEHLLQIEHALAGDYRNETVRQVIAGLIGPAFLRALRDPARPIAAVDRRHLFRATRDKLRALRQRISAMPENESDRVWRVHWQEYEPAEAA